jgi:magnesium-transporting ATPase (P-type)
LGHSHPEAQNFTLLIMVLFGTIHALSNRSEKRSLFTVNYFSNPFLAIATPTALVIHLISMKYSRHEQSDRDPTGRHISFCCSARRSFNLPERRRNPQGYPALASKGVQAK